VRGLSRSRRTEAAGTESVPGVVVRLVDGTPLDSRARARLLRRLAVILTASARRAGAAAIASGRWLTEAIEELAPHVPVRDLATLRSHHHGLSRDELARALIDSAARATGAVGAAGGVVSSLEFTAPPLLLTSPVQVAAETLAVVAVELKLVAELHEVYGRAAVGTPAVRAAAYLGAWTRRRGIDPFAGRRELRRRVMRRAGGNVATVLPFMAGAVAGASLNSRETRKLGERIAKDLGAHLR
jgi:uncharacterized membrane protein YoaK (UPF0700 family)